MIEFLVIFVLFCFAFRICVVFFLFSLKHVSCVPV